MRQDKGILIFNAVGFNLRLVSAMLEAEDCTVYVTSHPLEAIHILRNNDIDLILAPPHLDGMEGSEFKELAEKIRPGVSTFLLPLNPQTADDTEGSQAECHVNLKEFVQFIQNHIRIENHLLDQAASFKEFFFTFTDRLLQLFEAKDHYFFNNNHLVATLSCKVAQNLRLEEKLIEAINLAALLRDIGKIAITHEILNDTRQLEKKAFSSIRNHPQNAIQLLRQISFPWNVDSIIKHHHEHYDGNGYPDGLKGRGIPLGSRIISVADAYVAMTTDRPYRKALAKEFAINELMKMSGSQFDPEIVENLVAVLNQESAEGTARKRALILYKDEALAAFMKLNINNEDLQIFFALCSEGELENLLQMEIDILIAEEDALNCCSTGFTAAIRRSAEEKATPFILITDTKELVIPEDDLFIEWISKPIDIDILNTKITNLLGKTVHKSAANHNGAELRGVAGSLEEMGITDIIQVLNMGLKTAKVTISGEKAKGEIFLKYGKVVGARTGELKGHQAFFELIGWEKGIFNILHGKTSDEENVTMDTMTLLLEAARVLDEKRYHVKTEI